MSVNTDAVKEARKEIENANLSALAAKCQEVLDAVQSSREDLDEDRKDFDDADSWFDDAEAQLSAAIDALEAEYE